MKTKTKQFPNLDEEYIVKWSKDIFEVRNKHAKDLGRKIIGKFTQGGKYYQDRQSSRLIIDNVEYDFIIADATLRIYMSIVKTLFLSDGTKFGTIIIYTYRETNQDVHLRSSILAYASINLLSMINRFPESAVRVATDSFYKVININKKWLNLQIPTKVENYGKFKRKYCVIILNQQMLQLKTIT